MSLAKPVPPTRRRGHQKRTNVVQQCTIEQIPRALAPWAGGGGIAPWTRPRRRSMPELSCPPWALTNPTPFITSLPLCLPTHILTALSWDHLPNKRFALETFVSGSDPGEPNLRQRPNPQTVQEQHQKVLESREKRVIKVEGGGENPQRSSERFLSKGADRLGFPRLKGIPEIQLYPSRHSRGLKAERGPCVCPGGSV